MLAAEGLAWLLAGALVSYANVALPSRSASLAAWVANWEWIVPIGLIGMIVLLFPDGRLPSPRWRAVAWTGVGAAVLTVLVAGFTAGPLPEAPAVENPFGLPAAGPALVVLGIAAPALSTLVLAAMLGSVAVRFRRADGVRRRQLAWLVYAAGTVAVAFTIADILDALDVGGRIPDDLRVGSLLAIPIGIAVAVLRYRLYDIDILINKTLVYIGLVGFIAAVYVAVVAGIGAAVGSGAGSNVALAVVATAMVAVAFQPVRTRLERWARRIVFGAPTAAEVEAGISIRTLGAFQVFRDGRPVPLSAWQSKKARTLVKILLAHRGRAASREVLMETLWPDEDPALASRRLSVALTTARGVLDPDKRYPADHFLVGDKDSIRLDLSHVPVDVDDFLGRAEVALADLRVESTQAATPLREAALRYTGDFLEEDPYDDWAAPLRGEARAAMVAVTRAMAELAERSGDHDGSARYYLLLLDRDSWDEPAHLGLVEMLARAGRHGEARQRYAVYVDRMAEIDVPPKPYPVLSQAAPPA